MLINHIQHWKSIKDLKSEILVASNNKISSINSSISSKQSQIRRLREQMNSMET